MHRISHRFWCVVALFAVLGLSACCTQGCAPADATPLTPVALYPTPLMDDTGINEGGADAASIPAPLPERLVRAGDVLSVRVAGEADLSGDYPVSDAGRVALPLVGAVDVGGRTAAEAAEAIAAAYRAGYLVRPQIQVTIQKDGA